eukprot:gene4914-34680_t
MVRDYINGLEAHLGETTRQAGRLVKKEADLSLALSEFGSAAQLLNFIKSVQRLKAGRLVKKEADLSSASSEFGNTAQLLGKFDDSASRSAFDVLCAHAQQVSAASRQRAAEMANTFEAPLKEMTRTVKSVQHTMADRAAALSFQVQSKAELGSKMIKLAKLRGTSGTKEERVQDAEKELLHESKVAYDTLVAGMTEELYRLENETNLRANQKAK